MFCLILLILLFSRRHYWGGWGSPYYGYGYGGYPHRGYGYAYGQYPYGAYTQYNPYARGYHGYHRPYGCY